MLDELKKLIKSLKGSLVYLSVDNYIINLITNAKFDEIYSLERTKIFSNKNKKNNNIDLKKIKKKFKKKIDYMLCDVNEANVDLNRIIYYSYKLVGKKIIYYGVYDSYDVDRIAKKYRRFKCSTDKFIYGNEFILKIDMTSIKVSKLFIYKIIDLFIDIFEGFGNLLMG